MKRITRLLVNIPLPKRYIIVREMNIELNSETRGKLLSDRIYIEIR